MNYAHWVSRVGASLIDSLAFLPFYLAGWLIDGPRAGSGSISRGGAAFWALFAVGVLVSGFNRWHVAGTSGQSLGKWALGLSLIHRVHGQPLGVGRAFLRDLAHVIDVAICFLGFLFPLWDGRRQTIADKIVNSVVVRA